MGSDQEHHLGLLLRRHADHIWLAKTMLQIGLDNALLLERFFSGLVTRSFNIGPFSTWTRVVIEVDAPLIILFVCRFRNMAGPTHAELHQLVVGGVDRLIIGWVDGLTVFWKIYRLNFQKLFIPEILGKGCMKTLLVERLLFGIRANRRCRRPDAKWFINVH